MLKVVECIAFVLVRDRVDIFSQLHHYFSTKINRMWVFLQSNHLGVKCWQFDDLNNFVQNHTPSVVRSDADFISDLDKSLSAFCRFENNILSFTSSDNLSNHTGKQIDIPVNESPASIVHHQSLHHRVCI